MSLFDRFRRATTTITIACTLPALALAQEAEAPSDTFKVNLDLSVLNVVDTVEAAAAICDVQSRLISDNDAMSVLGSGGVVIYYGDEPMDVVQASFEATTNKDFSSVVDGSRTETQGSFPIEIVKTGQTPLDMWTHVTCRVVLFDPAGWARSDDPLTDLWFSGVYWRAYPCEDGNTEPAMMFRCASRDSFDTTYTTIERP